MIISTAARVAGHLHVAGLCRREGLQAGFLGAFGMSVGGAARPAAAALRSRAKSVILVWMPGGPPQMQLWDLKPDSPSEYRGSARPVKTSAPGVEFGQVLPLTARQAHRLALV